MGNRTPAYWPTRVLLVGGILLTVFVVYVASLMLDDCSECFGYIERQGVTITDLVVAVGVATAVLGLVWMVRIFRGPRDEPPAWRHRDR